MMGNRERENGRETKRLHYTSKQISKSYSNDRKLNIDTELRHNAHTSLTMAAINLRASTIMMNTNIL